MIEKYHRKTPFKLIHNARAVKLNLMQQFESEIGIILPTGVKNALCTQPVPILGKELAVMKLLIKENRK